MISVRKKDEAHQRRKSIFVLDDWPDIVNLFERTGAMNGFSVISAMTNTEARSKLSYIQDPGSLTAAFIDVEIGADSGLDIYEEIRRTMPSLPVIIMTGRPDNKRLVDLIADNRHTSFLSKPFFIEEIIEIIKEPRARAGDIRELTELTLFMRDAEPA